jgi:hypothetical protein
MEPVTGFAADLIHSPEAGVYEATRQCGGVVVPVLEYVDWDESVGPVLATPRSCECPESHGCGVASFGGVGAEDVAGFAVIV